MSIFPVQTLEQPYDLFTGFAVQGTGRLVREKDGWFIDQCTRNRNSLLLPT